MSTKAAICPFNIGDIVLDTINNDIGVLLRRYSLFEELEFIKSDTPEEYLDVIVWDIFWTGANLWPFESGIQVYTEEGLEILSKSGALIHYKNT